MKAMVDEVYRQVKTAVDTTAATDSDAANEALMMPSQQLKLHGSQTLQNDNDDSMDDSDHEEESTTLAAWREAYLDELSHRYLAYTHGTVVEFTQEEGCVGLPEPIARALLRPNAYSLVQRSSNSDSGNNAINDIPTKRTVDPAIAVVTSSENDDSTCTTIKQQQSTSSTTRMEVDDEKTPGHPAYNAFDIPSLPIEIIPITSLPPGKDCTFTPTTQSIRAGFYDLKDIKAVLEQSLMRTRATLSRGDVIRTWRRGVCFDLMVSKLSSDSVMTSSSSLSLDYGVVSCVNTDLNVDIGVPEEEEEGEGGNDDVKGAESENSGGRTLAEPSSSSSQTTSISTTTAQQSKETTNKAIELPPEPPENETQGVCTIQIRGGGINTNNTTGRRRFKTNTSTMGDLFSFASNISGHDVLSFRLVTRFPRKVYKLSSLANDDEDDDDADYCYGANDLLENVGIVNGQILFMIEKLCHIVVV
eukprot:scaffold24646_cov20-Cyclotella_meneghiniana.AAC.2